MNLNGNQIQKKKIITELMYIVSSKNVWTEIKGRNYNNNLDSLCNEYLGKLIFFLYMSFKLAEKGIIPIKTHDAMLCD